MSKLKKNIFVRYLILFLINILYYGGFLILKYVESLYNPPPLVPLSGLCFYFSLPLFLVLYGIFSCKLTNQIVGPLVMLCVFSSLYYATSSHMYHSNRKMEHLLFDMAYSLIYMVLPTITSVITKLVIRKKNKNKNSAD